MKTSSLCHELTIENHDFFFFTPAPFQPNQQKYQHMLRLIAYDIKSPKRLRKVAIACLDYGIRVEYSVFECDLTEEHFNQLWTRLSNTIDENEDRILSYRICANCVTKIDSLGTVCRPGKPLLYIL